LGNPNPDKPEKMATKARRHKAKMIVKLVFVFWCLGGEPVLPQNAQKY